MCTICGLEEGAPGPYICSRCKAPWNFIRWKTILFFSWNLFLRESSFRNVNCLKWFDLKLFFVYSKVVEAPPFGTLAHNFCFVQNYITCFRACYRKCGSKVVHKLFNKTVQKLSAQLSQWISRHLWKRETVATAPLPSLNIDPCFHLILQ